MDVRRSATRFVTRTFGVHARHSLSFGHHYDPDNTSFGLLIAHNEEVLAPGTGYDRHAHRDVEIVTWVLSGELTHEDSTGASGVVRPGAVQRLRAGSGVEHSERNAGREPVHYVQMWLRSGPGEPEYAQQVVDHAPVVPVVSGLGAPGALPLRSPATLWVARPQVSDAVRLPAAPHLHAFVATGRVDAGGDPAVALHAGDALRLTEERTELRARAASEMLIWTMSPGQPPPGTEMDVSFERSKPL